MNSATRLIQAIKLMASSNDVIKDTHGNVSCLVPDKGIIWIKPSGMPYEQITQDDVCGLAIVDGHTLGPSKRKPSVDASHHLSIYQRHPWVGAICHTHSPYATAFAMAGENIECACTEQADYFGADIFCRAYRDLDSWGMALDLDREEKAVLLQSHGCLTFAEDPVKAVKLAAALENVAQKTFICRTLSLRRERSLPCEEIEKWHRRYTNVYGQ